jgi:hypothetical protein
MSKNIYMQIIQNRMDAKKFAELKKSLKLKVNYAEYPTMLIKMFNNCIKDSIK